MAQVTIYKLGMGGERCNPEHHYVKSDSREEIVDAMTKVGCPPSGWRSGLAWEADINPDISHKKEMSIEQLQKLLAG